MNVLSTFDGMSCGMVALLKAGVTVDKYYASEINKHAIKVSQKNFPRIVQLGDVTKVSYNYDSLEVQRNSDSWLTVDKVKIDLLLCGSPCQSFSIAGDGTGFYGKSALVNEFFRLKRELGDVLFLLENVKMKKEFSDEITKELGVEPIIINSSLLSGQNRVRMYWTNIPGIVQPQDLGIRLIDILEENVSDKYYHSEAAINYMNREVKGGRNHWDFAHHSDSNKDKSACVTANFRKGVPYNVLIERNAVRQLNPHSGCSTNQPKMQHRIYDSSGKAPALTSFSGRLSIYPDKNDLIRKLTPVECERLMNLPDNYSEGVTEGHRYEMIGNGWEVNTLAHIFKNLNL